LSRLALSFDRLCWGFGIESRYLLVYVSKLLL
jgi:hypothetical protein